MFMTPHPDALKPEDSRLKHGNPEEDAYAFLRATVAEAIAAGRFRPELADADLVAQMVWAGTHGVVSLHIAKCKDAWVDWRNPTELAHAQIEVMIRGLDAARQRSPEMAVDLATKSLLHDKLRFLITVSGVAFAVTLVFVQVGLFLGLLDNASRHHRAHRRGPLGHLAQHAQRRLRAHVPGDRRPARALGAGRRARRQPHRLVHERQPADRRGGGHAGLRAGGLRALEHSLERGEGDLADLRRGQYIFLDDSAVKRFGPFAVGDYREVLGQRLKIIGRTKDARSFTTTPISFMDYERAQTLNPQSLQGKTTYILVKLAPGADAAAVAAPRSRAGSRTTTSTRSTSGRRGRGTTGSSPPGSA